MVDELTPSTGRTFGAGPLLCLRCGAELWFTSENAWGEIRVAEPLSTWSECRPHGPIKPLPAHDVLDLHDPESVERWLAS